MNTKLALLNILLITGLLLAGCGPSSISIQIPVPGTDNSGGAPQAQNNTNMILIYVLLGALIVIALAALLGKGKSSGS